MNKVRFEVNADTNYVYHMLSCARCGYDNAYGAKYRQFHTAADLAVLKKHEAHLTVRGGVHCGKLYWPMICQCACGAVKAAEFYRSFVPTRDIADLSAACEEICDVMVRNYGIYMEKVWPRTRAEIEGWVLPLVERFEESGFTDRAESELGISIAVFRAMMTNSMENGPEAIDISSDQDVFGICRTYEDAFYFIAHEYLIYLLKAALKGTSAFSAFETWSITEGLAEFYIRKILGKCRFFDLHMDKSKFFDLISEEHPTSSPRELYLAGEQYFIEAQKGRGL